jgi:hypothetical protein
MNADGDGLGHPDGAVSWNQATAGKACIGGAGITRLRHPPQASLVRATRVIAAG